MGGGADRARELRQRIRGMRGQALGLDARAACLGARELFARHPAIVEVSFEGRRHGDDPLLYRFDPRFRLLERGGMTTRWLSDDALALDLREAIGRAELLVEAEGLRLSRGQELEQLALWLLPEPEAREWLARLEAEEIDEQTPPGKGSSGRRSRL